jgi:hypothetical protein
MASVRRLGYWPWCTWQNIDDFIRANVPGATMQEKRDNYAPFRLYYENLTDATGLEQNLDGRAGEGVTPLQALALYWRVRRWRVSFTWRVAVQGEALPRVIPVEQFFYRNVISERSLICDNSDPFNHTLSPNPTTLNVIAFDSLLFPAELTFQIPSTGIQTKSSNSPHSVLEINSDNRQMFYVFTNIDLRSLSEDLVEHGYLSYQPSEHSVFSGGRINFLGYSVAFGFYTNDFSLAYQQPLKSLVGVENFIAEAVEYWPYDPGDGGGPIYNINTGAQIRPMP